MELVASVPLQVQTPTITVEALMKEVDELKAKLAVASSVSSVVTIATNPPIITAAMTVEEAKAHVASFEGKRGRRPASFLAAQALIDASLTAEDKAAAKEARKAAAKAAKVAAKEAKAAKKAARHLATLTTRMVAAKAATDKVAKVFLRLSTKSEALEAQVKALTPETPPTK